MFGQSTRLGPKSKVILLWSLCVTSAVRLWHAKTGSAAIRGRYTVPINGYDDQGGDFSSRKHRVLFGTSNGRRCTHVLASSPRGWHLTAVNLALAVVLKTGHTLYHTQNIKTAVLLNRLSDPAEIDNVIVKWVVCESIP